MMTHAAPASYERLLQNPLTLKPDGLDREAVL